MSFGQYHGPPLPSTEEMRLHQLEELIAQAREHERREAARKAAEAAARAERERATGGYTLEDLERMRAELVAKVAERETHLRVDAEEQLFARRRDRLLADREALLRQVATVDAELEIVDGRLSPT